MDNLFSAEWSVGDLSSIELIKHFGTIAAVTVISFVGFAIVVSSIMKNALAGLYATYPRIFDQIHEAHTTKGGGGSGEGGNKILKSLGGIKLALLGLLPDIKTLTEFSEGDGSNLDPKAYFMKSIPAMVVTIFVGVFIFYGYPMRVAEKFADGGTQIIDLFLMNVDPSAWIDGVFTTFTRPDFATNGSKDDVNKAINKISSEVWTKYVGKLKDMTKEKRVDVGRKIEEWVTENVNAGLAEYCNTSRYKMAVEATVYTEGAPDLSRVHNKDVNGVKTFAYAHDMASWAPGTTIDTEGMYVSFYLTFTPIATKEEVSTVPCGMTVGKVTWDTTKKKGTFSLGAGNGKYLQTGNRATAMSDTGINCDVTIEGDTLVFTYNSSKTGIDKSKSFSVSGLYYIVNNVRHEVNSINVDNGKTTIEFQAADSGLGIGTWQFGGDPIVLFKEAGSSTEP